MVIELNWKIASIVLLFLLIGTSGMMIYQYIQKESIASERDKLTQEIKVLRRFELRRPSEGELAAFLISDLTDRHSYQETNFTYVCTHFARDLKANARVAGWNFSLVLIYISVDFNETRVEKKLEKLNKYTVLETTLTTVTMHHYAGSHAANKVYLSDGSFVYVEPQTDGIYRNLTDLVWSLDYYDYFGIEDREWRIEKIDVTTYVIVW